MATPPLDFRGTVLGTLLFSAVVLLAFAGCATSYEPEYGGYSPSPQQVAIEDTYLYYPEYEIYYNPARREYVFFDGRSWIASPVPPRDYARGLRRAPHVEIYLQDSPEYYHREVVRDYPRRWRQHRERTNDWERRRYHHRREMERQR